MYKLEDIGLRIPPPRDPGVVGNIPNALFQSRRAPRMYPEHPCLGRSLSGSIAVLDSKLRLPAPPSAPCTGRICLCSSPLTLHRPSRQELFKTPARRNFGEAAQVSFRDRRSPSPTEREWWMKGVVVFPVVLFTTMCDERCARRPGGNSNLPAQVHVNARGIIPDLQTPVPRACEGRSNARMSHPEP